MACNISIDSITGTSTNPAEMNLWITGKVEDCEKDVEGDAVEVEISCPATEEPFTTRKAQVDSEGNWSVLISTTGTNCRCGSPIQVAASCVTDSSCPVIQTIDALECIDCPEIIREQGDDVGIQPPEIECQSDGTALVIFEVTVFNTTNEQLFAQIDAGPGGSVESQTPVPVNAMTNLTFSVVCRYATPASPQPSVSLLNANQEPLNCPPFEINVSSIPPCACPQVEEIETRVDQCTVNFTGPFGADPTGCYFIWNFGDGDTDTVFDSPNVIHTYDASGSYPVSVTAVCGECVATTNTIVEITRCEGNDDEECPWYDPRCWGWCGALGGVLVTLIAAYIIMIATGTAQDVSSALANLPGFPNIDPTTLAGVIGGIIGFLMIFYGELCGYCLLGRVMVIAGGLALFFMVVLLIFGVTMPHWVGALITLIGFMVAGGIVIRNQCD